MRHCQIAARSGRRQSPGRRHADVSQSLGTHRQAAPSKGARNSGDLDPKLPTPLQTALNSLYSHYKLVDERVAARRHRCAACFIVVCSNTSVSKLVYEWIAGWQRTNEDGEPYTSKRPP